MEENKKVFIVTVECLLRKEIEVLALVAEEAKEVVRADYRHGDNIPDFDSENEVWDSLTVTTATLKKDGQNGAS